jgi:hypothetical protein
MYRNCIFCSGDLGANQVLERFPVGRRLAYDAWKGRLWVVCPGCSRWNLSALEERWEPVEDAERLFRDARLRVRSENIGLAKLADGTRLIRVGEALPGELAAWRYGDQLVRRRRQYLIVSGAAVAGALVVAGGALAVGALGGLGGAFNAVYQGWAQKQNQKVLLQLDAAQSPTGKPLVIRRWHALSGWLEEQDDGVALHLPAVDAKKQPRNFLSQPKFGGEVAVLPDPQARAVLSRAMVHVNRSGASRGRLRDALAALETEGSAEAFLRRTARAGRTVGKRGDMSTRQMKPPEALALEMALHDEQERRAMEGELTLLESAWRDAERIAAIADALPDDPLTRIESR